MSTRSPRRPKPLGPPRQRERALVGLLLDARGGEVPAACEAELRELMLRWLREGEELRAELLGEGAQETRQGASGAGGGDGCQRGQDGEGRGR